MFLYFLYVPIFSLYLQQFDEQKEIVNVQGKTYKAAKRGGEVDERDDFLHQIREKVCHYIHVHILC